MENYHGEAGERRTAVAALGGLRRGWPLGLWAWGVVLWFEGHIGYLGYIGIIEKKMETAIVYWVYVGIVFTVLWSGELY